MQDAEDAASLSMERQLSLPISPFFFSPEMVVRLSMFKVQCKGAKGPNREWVHEPTKPFGLSTEQHELQVQPDSYGPDDDSNQQNLVSAPLTSNATNGRVRPSTSSIYSSSSNFSGTTYDSYKYDANPLFHPKFHLMRVSLTRTTKGCPCIWSQMIQTQCCCIIAGNLIGIDIKCVLRCFRRRYHRNKVSYLDNVWKLVGPITRAKTFTLLCTVDQILGAYKIVSDWCPIREAQLRMEAQLSHSRLIS